jgi:hypothetical protein
VAYSELDDDGHCGERQCTSVSSIYAPVISVCRQQEDNPLLTDDNESTWNIVEKVLIWSGCRRVSLGAVDTVRRGVHTPARASVTSNSLVCIHLRMLAKIVRNFLNVLVIVAQRLRYEKELPGSVGPLRALSVLRWFSHSEKISRMTYNPVPALLICFQRLHGVRMFPGV